MISGGVVIGLVTTCYDYISINMFFGFDMKQFLCPSSKT